ncbi:hypothetical protein [Agarivorans sp. DSG3-1]|uniref:hypothetical protein n=1 Tax=Agarivorans sp. DSG3-1 TaxID=3342249 RepID=UPI00398F75C5
MSKYYKEKPFVYPQSSPEDSKNLFFRNGWSVCKRDENYFFSYISGQLQGAGREIEITKSDYEQAKVGKICFDEMCRKYGVH